MDKRVYALLALAVLVAPLLSLGIAHADVVSVNPGESYNVTFMYVNVTSDEQVTFQLSYVNEDNETVPYMTLSGTEFTYNASVPLILTVSVDASATAPANLTFNDIIQTASSTGQATITPSDKVVRIPVSAPTGSTIKVSVSPNGDPYARAIGIVLEYSDGTYKLMTPGSYHEDAAAADSDWPASVTPDLAGIWGSKTYTFTVDKDVQAVIIYISTYQGQWDVSVSVSQPSTSETTTTSTATVPQPSGSSNILAADVDIMGHHTNVATIVVLLIVFLGLIWLLAGRRR